MEQTKLGRGSTWMFVLLSFLLLSACASMDGGGLNKAEIGGLGGMGIGALAGQAIGASTGATLIGAGVGAGLGYIIGNEMDKKDAQKRRAANAEETAPLANTVWQVVSVVPERSDIKSKVGRFSPDGTLTTTTVYSDGRAATHSERYRIVGNTLIINHDNYVINARFRIEGKHMYMDTGTYSVVLQRI